MSVLSVVHDHVFDRRLRVLADRLAPVLPDRATVLDIGCGDGALATRLLALRPDVTIRGIDVLVRPNAAIPVEAFDGRSIPYADESFDAAVIVDVLHHAADPLALLAEARRVVRQVVVIKDHLADRPGALPVLRFMDWVGNARHGVRLPYTYWRSSEWYEMFRAARLTVRDWSGSVPLYPFPAALLFGWRLHFIAALAPVTRA
jgi:SAM-dependent methyltransferase